MRADELVALAAAHGIDFEHVAGSESNTKGQARKRRMGREERRNARGRPIVDTADGSGTRVTRPRAWTHAEVGISAGGLVVDGRGRPIKGRDGKYQLRLPRLPFLAACYSWGGDRDGYKELHRGITLKAIDMAVSQQWVWQVELVDGTHTYYLERLAEMVLDAEGCKPAFADPRFYHVYMGVSEVVWHKPLFGYFLELQAQYERWLDTTRGVMGQWIRRADLQDEPEGDMVAPELSNAT